MRDRPILFSAPMIRAILEGRKTQTRRVLKPQPPDYVKGSIAPQELRGEPKRHSKPYFDAYNGGPFWCWWDEYDRCGDGITIPYVKGDRIWVRETWAVSTIYDGISPRDLIANFCKVGYLADDGVRGCKVRPAIFMPRWASRITLTVTNVRVQRLQDISEADAAAEGVDAVSMADVPRQAAWTRRHDFSRLWDSINGKRDGASWTANSWVVAITFDPVFRNIDAMTREAVPT